MENENFVIIDERKVCIIKKISKIECLAKVGEEYLIEMKTKRGYKTVLYNTKTHIIKNFYNNKKGYIDEKVVNKIEKEIGNFDLVVNGEFQYSCNIKIFADKYENHQRKLYEELAELKYNHYCGLNYDFVISFSDSTKNNINVTELFTNTDLLMFLNNMSRVIFSKPANKYLIEDNPIYINAINNNDLTLIKTLKIYYGVETKEDCEYLSNVTNIKILPTLSEEFNQNYYVSLKVGAVDILMKSNYRLLHRPYFAMKGSTHEYYTLNPHTKVGVDASPVNCKPITFEEYLELFNENENKI